MPKLLPAYNKTRIAPTPSGYLHLGNILSFVTTTALAKQSGAKIFLRIDDLDRLRVNPKYVQDIFDTLNFLEIPWDEGPLNAKDFEDNYSQIHRMPLYKEALKYLSDNKKVFACACSRSQSETCTCINEHIPLNTENVSWRLATPNNTELQVKNYNGEIIQASMSVEMQDFVIKKKDGFPAYQLTSVIDDLQYGIDLIIRGEDLWPSTVAQHQLALALGKEEFSGIGFYHHLLITESNGNKMSKSAGSTSIRYLRKNGKTAAEVYSMIAALLGINTTISNWRQLFGLII